MQVTKTALEGVAIIEPAVFRDERGAFAETFSEREFADAVAPVHFVQENESRSRRGVVRGLHFQKAPHAQAKLVRVASGRILDVAVDMRRHSPTFGRHVAVELSAENRRQLFIPRGCAHGFVSLSEETVVVYKVDDYYAPASDAGVLWNDPSLNIDWGIAPDDAIISTKDAALPLFINAYKFEI
ncbi:MAG: dTDP-4-dehydrorhamnose 3,5-epimerase [Alistipes sp.]|nr:dTDP-4-dehydrorhamnose 3,5-epimerase [Alistipes sp.]